MIDPSHRQSRSWEVTAPTYNPPSQRLSQSSEAPVKTAPLSKGQSSFLFAKEDHFLEVAAQKKGKPTQLTLDLTLVKQIKKWLEQANDFDGSVIRIKKYFKALLQTQAISSLVFFGSGFRAWITSEQIESWLLNNGFTQDEIAQFRDLLQTVKSKPGDFDFKGYRHKATTQELEQSFELLDTRFAEKIKKTPKWILEHFYEKRSVFQNPTGLTMGILRLKGDAKPINTELAYVEKEDCVPLELIIESNSLCPKIFHRDLFLNLTDVINNQNGQQITELPLDIEDPARTLYDLVSCNLSLVNPSYVVDGEAYLRLIQGFCLGERSLDEETEAYVQSKFKDASSIKPSARIFYFLKKHYKEDPLTQMVYLINFLASLKNALDSFQVIDRSVKELDKEKLTGVHKLIYDALMSKSVTASTLFAFLEITLFIAICNQTEEKNPPLRFIQNRGSLAIQMRIPHPKRKLNWLINLDLQQAVKTLNQLSSNNTDQPQWEILGLIAEELLPKTSAKNTILEDLTPILPKRNVHVSFLLDVTFLFFNSGNASLKALGCYTATLSTRMGSEIAIPTDQMRNWIQRTAHKPHELEQIEAYLKATHSPLCLKKIKEEKQTEKQIIRWMQAHLDTQDDEHCRQAIALWRESEGDRMQLGLAFLQKLIPLKPAISIDLYLEIDQLPCQYTEQKQFIFMELAQQLRAQTDGEAAIKASSVALAGAKLLDAKPGKKLKVETKNSLWILDHSPTSENFMRAIENGWISLEENPVQRWLESHLENCVERSTQTGEWNVAIHLLELAAKHNLNLPTTEKFKTLLIECVARAPDSPLYQEFIKKKRLPTARKECVSIYLTNAKRFLEAKDYTLAYKWIKKALKGDPSNLQVRQLYLEWIRTADLSSYSLDEISEHLRAVDEKSPGIWKKVIEVTKNTKDEAWNLLRRFPPATEDFARYGDCWIAAASRWTKGTDRNPLIEHKELLEKICDSELPPNAKFSITYPLFNLGLKGLNCTTENVSMLDHVLFDLLAPVCKNGNHLQLVSAFKSFFKLCLQADNLDLALNRLIYGIKKTSTLDGKDTKQHLQQLLAAIKRSDGDTSSRLLTQLSDQRCFFDDEEMMIINEILNSKDEALKTKGVDLFFQTITRSDASNNPYVAQALQKIAVGNEEDTIEILQGKRKHLTKFLKNAPKSLIDEKSVTGILCSILDPLLKKAIEAKDEKLVRRCIDDLVPHRNRIYKYFHKNGELAPVLTKWIEGILFLSEKALGTHHDESSVEKAKNFFFEEQIKFFKNLPLPHIACDRQLSTPEAGRNDSTAFFAMLSMVATHKWNSDYLGRKIRESIHTFLIIASGINLHKKPQFRENLKSLITSYAQSFLDDRRYVLNHDLKLLEDVIRLFVREKKIFGQPAEQPLLFSTIHLYTHLSYPTTYKLSKDQKREMINILYEPLLSRKFGNHLLRTFQLFSTILSERDLFTEAELLRIYNTFLQYFYSLKSQPIIREEGKPTTVHEFIFDSIKEFLSTPGKSELKINLLHALLINSVLSCQEVYVFSKLVFNLSSPPPPPKFLVEGTAKIITESMGFNGLFTPDGYLEKIKMFLDTIKQAFYKDAIMTFKESIDEMITVYGSLAEEKDFQAIRELWKEIIENAEENKNQESLKTIIHDLTNNKDKADKTDGTN